MKFFSIAFRNVDQHAFSTRKHSYIHQYPNSPKKSIESSQVSPPGYFSHELYVPSTFKHAVLFLPNCMDLKNKNVVIASFVPIILR